MNQTAYKDRTLLSDLALSGLGILALAAVLSLVFSRPVTSSPGAADSRIRIGQTHQSTNDVRRRSEGALVWNDLRIGNAVYESDAVYVAEDSQAVVKLQDGSTVEIDENSLVVVRRPSEGAAVLLDVVRGGISSQAGSQGVAIRTGSTSMKLEKSSSARVRLRSNQTAQIDVSGGRARVATKNRGKVDVQAGQRQSVDAQGQAQDIQKFEIALAAPKPGERIFYTGEATDVRFQWQAQPGRGPYLFELSADPEFENVILERKPRKTAVAVKELSEGVYHWRVRRRGKAGMHISAERRLTVIEDQPPALYRPRSGQVVYLPEGQVLRLAWTRVPGVGGYQVEIARGQEVVVRARADRSFHLHRKRLPEGHYCCKVRSDEPERGASPWSQSRCFRIIHRPLPRAPKLYKPKVEEVPTEKKKPRGSWLKRLFIGVAHAQAVPSRAIVLRWEAIPGIQTYIIEIAEDREFKNVVVKKHVPHNYYRWTLTHRTYYWRVKSVDAAGREGEFSKVKIIGAVVAGPKPLAPKPGAIIGWAASAPRIALEWQGSDLLAGYTVTIARNEAFTKDVTTYEVKGKPQLVFRPPEPGKFHWRVVGIDLNGRPTESGPGRSFMVVPKAPDPIRPQKDEVYPWEEEELKIHLSWSKRPVEKYKIEVASDRRFRRKAASLTSPKTSVAFNPKTMGILYWRVRGMKPDSAWSRILPFKIAPAIPDLVSPPEGETTRFRGETASVELGWQAVPRASAYLVEVASESKQLEPLNVEGTSAKLENLPAGHYTWKVRAVVSPGIESDASPGRTFDLIPYGPPRAPALSAPEDGKEIVTKKPQPVLLSWLAVGEASSYEVELATSRSFSETVDQRKVKDLEITIATPPQGELFWRVRSVDPAGLVGNWSAPRAFTYRVEVEISRPKPKKPSRTAFHIGPRVSFFYNLGAVATARYGLELGYRLPVWERRLGFILSAGYYTASESASDGVNSISADSRLHVVPIELVGVCSFPTKIADMYLGGGLNLDVTRATVSIPTLPQLANTGIELGFVAVTGAERTLGPGSIFLEFRYTYASKGRELVEVDPGGLTFGTGYRIRLW